MKFSLIINGSTEEFFQSQRGLRQGEPISPFLLLLAMEGLIHMIGIANGKGRLKGFSAQTVRRDASEVINLLYEMTH